MEDCPTPFFEVDGDARVCVSECDWGFVDDRKCADACPDKAFEDVTDPVPYRKCVDFDSCSRYIYDSVSAEGNRIDYAHCMDSCPEALPVLATNSTECKTC